MGVNSEVQSSLVFVSDVLNSCILPSFQSEFCIRNVGVDCHMESGL